MLVHTERLLSVSSNDSQQQGSNLFLYRIDTTVCTKTPCWQGTGCLNSIYCTVVTYSVSDVRAC